MGGELATHGAVRGADPRHKGAVRCPHARGACLPPPPREDTHTTTHLLQRIDEALARLIKGLEVERRGPRAGVGVERRLAHLINIRRGWAGRASSCGRAGLMFV